MTQWAPIAFSVIMTVIMLAESAVMSNAANKIHARQQKLKRVREAEDELGLPHYPFGPLSAPYPDHQPKETT